MRVESSGLRGEDQSGLRGARDKGLWVTLSGVVSLKPVCAAGCAVLKGVEPLPVLILASPASCSTDRVAGECMRLAMTVLSGQYRWLRQYYAGSMRPAGPVLSGQYERSHGSTKRAV